MEDAELPDAEKARILKGIQEIVRPWIREAKPPLVLHHYTSTAGFHGIVKDGAIRATHIAFMNDHREYIHASDMMKNEVDSLLNAGAAGDVLRFLEAMKKNLDGLELSNMPPFFVACFSGEEDDLSQWRAYGQGEGGISLAFEVKKLKDAADAVGANLVPVEYNEDRQLQICKQGLKWACENYPEALKTARPHDATAFLQVWLRRYIDTIVYVAPLIKDSRFSAEKEWRIIAHERDVAKINVLPTSGSLKPHVNIQLRPTAEKNGKIAPLKGAMVGPSPFKEHTARAAETWLRKHGMDMDVETSDIPFRKGM